MTDPQQPNGEVTQADREAAAQWLLAVAPPSVLLGIRSGDRDDHRLVLAFARHRIAAEQAARLTTPPVQDAGEVEAGISEAIRRAIGEGLDACPHGLHSERITAIYDRIVEVRDTTLAALAALPAPVTGEKA